MPTIMVKKFFLNGKELKDLNGKKVRSVTVGENRYEVPNYYNLTINTNNDQSESAIWTIPENTYVDVDGEDISCTDIFSDSHSINVGSKSGYIFDGWDHGSFSINGNTTIEGLWIPDTPVTHEYVFVEWQLTTLTVGNMTSYSLTGTIDSVTSGLDKNLAEIRIHGGTLQPSATESGVIYSSDPSVEVIFEIVYSGVQIGSESFNVIFGDEYSTTYVDSYMQS